MDDIDALKRELQQTRLAYQMAVAINHLKSSFLGRVAHELRSPLSSMISIHQMILADLCESPAEERQFIAQGQLAGRKLMAMLDEMINLSKLESGTIPLEREIFSLTKLWEDWASLTYLQAANRNIQLKFSPLTDDIAIIADYQGAGLGRKLVETVLAHPRINRVERVYLMTTNQEKFYRRIGFQSNATTTMVLFNRYPEEFSCPAIEVKKKRSV